MISVSLLCRVHSATLINIRGSLTHHGEYEPPQVSVDGQVDHLLDWVEVWIVQVP